MPFEHTLPCVNQVILVGYISDKAPEFKTTGTGAKVATFSLQTTDHYMSNGQPKSFTTWHRVEVVGAAVNSLAGLKPNDYVAVTGSISSGSYTKEDGSKSYYTKIKAMTVRAGLPKSGDDGHNDDGEDAPF